MHDMFLYTYNNRFYPQSNSELYKYDFFCLQDSNISTSFLQYSILLIGTMRVFVSSTPPI